MTAPWRRPHVVGFIVQCSVCPQKAVIDSQPEADWVCPRCRDAHAGFGDIDIAQAEPTNAERDTRGWWARSWDSLGCGDDDYPIGGVTA